MTLFGSFLPTNFRRYASSPILMTLSFAGSLERYISFKVLRALFTLALDFWASGKVFKPVKNKPSITDFPGGTYKGKKTG